MQQGDLSAAQRIAARAFELQFHPRSRDAQLYDTFDPSNLRSSPLPPPLRAALRAAEAQRPSSAHPFDVRNVEPVCERVALTKHHHHRKYTLAIHDETLNDTTTNLSSTGTGAGACTDPSLVIAIKYNADVELIRWLIEMGHEQKGPSVDADGNTILHLATLYDRSDIIYAYSTYTTSHVASTLSDLIDAETLHDHRTALQLACIKGYDDVARQLLDLGAEVDLQDRAGNTALHFASAWGHISLVQLLIERGCSLAVKNAEGSTAVDYAYSHSVKNALETMGRARYESRKKTRRVPVTTAVVPSAVRPNAAAGTSTSFGQFFDEPPSLSATSSEGKEEADPSHRSSVAMAPMEVRGVIHHTGATTFAAAADSSVSVDHTAPMTEELIDDWDPEKTFAQPGQDLFPGNRGTFSSPPVQRIASPANFSSSSTANLDRGRASIDLYSEVLNQSPKTSNSAATFPSNLEEAVPTARVGGSGLVPSTSEMDVASGRRHQLSPTPYMLRLGGEGVQVQAPAQARWARRQQTS